MKIELKNILVSERLSEETTAFSATLYIEGKKAGTADNRGNGEMTNIRHDNQEGRLLIEAAEKYCKGLPSTDFVAGGETTKLHMDLETYVDMIVWESIKQKDLKRFKVKMEKAMENGVVYGIPEKQYRVMKLKTPVQLIMHDPKMEALLIRAIQEKVLPAMEKGDKILNTNFHPEFINALKIDPEKLLPLAGPEEKQKNNLDKGEHQGNKPSIRK